MGVGTPLDMLEAVHRGVDMFDCIIPTPLGERGGVFTSRGYLQLRRGVYKHSDEAARSGLRLPDLPALLARLSAPPDEDRRGARLAAARPAQPPLLPPAHARDPAEHPGGHVPSLYQEKRASCRSATSTTRARRPGRGRPRPSPSATTRCTWPARGSRASGTSPRARSCTRARRPWRRRESLYVEQSELAERLRSVPPRMPRTPRRSSSGTWASAPAANAMAAIRCYEQAAALHPSAPSTSSASRTISTRCGSPSPQPAPLPLPAPRRSRGHPRAPDAGSSSTGAGSQLAPRRGRRLRDARRR